MAGQTGPNRYAWTSSLAYVCANYAIKPASGVTGTVTPVIASTATTNTGTVDATLTITAPTGIEEGDLLLALIAKRSSNTYDFTAPSGWTLLNTAITGATTGVIAYYKVATLADESTANYLFDNATTATMIGTIHRITGAKTSAPLSDIVANGVNLDNCPSVTTTSNNSLVMYVVGQNTPATSGNSQPNNAYTSYAVSSGGAVALGLKYAYKYQATAGATGLGYYSLPSSPVNCITIAIEPASGGATTQRVYVVPGAASLGVSGLVDPSTTSIGKMLQFPTVAASTANYDLKGLACKDINSDGKDDVLMYLKNNTTNNAAGTSNISGGIALKEYLFAWFGQTMTAPGPYASKNIDDTATGYDILFNLTTGYPTGQDPTIIPQFTFGDVNNDGKKDIIFSRTTEDPYYTISGTTFTLNTDGSGTARADAGLSYVLYQPSTCTSATASTCWGATPSLEKTWFSYNFAGVDGIKIAGAVASDGMLVQDTADMNKDGKDDLLLTSGLNPTGGYFLFGKTTWPTAYDLNCTRDKNGVANTHCPTQVLAK